MILYHNGKKNASVFSKKGIFKIKSLKPIDNIGLICYNTYSEIHYIF